MEILGIGMPELVFILIIALLILGPKDREKAARTAGLWLNKIIHSDAWHVFRNTTAELRDLPGRLMRDANLELKKTDAEIRRELSASRRYSRYVAPGEEYRMDVHADGGEQTPAQEPELESDLPNNA